MHDSAEKLSHLPQSELVNAAATSVIAQEQVNDRWSFVAQNTVPKDDIGLKPECAIAGSQHCATSSSLDQSPYYSNLGIETTAKPRLGASRFPLHFGIVIFTTFTQTHPSHRGIVPGYACGDGQLDSCHLRESLPASQLNWTA